MQTESRIWCRIDPATCTRLRACSVLLLLVVLLLHGLREQDAILPPQRAETQPSDTDLHYRSISRIQAGEPYYAAVGQELRTLGYPAASPFNWRTPVHYQIVAWASPSFAVPGLRMLALLVVIGAVWAFASRRGAWPVAAGCLLLGPMLVPLVNERLVRFPEVCAGIIIGLSLALYARQVAFPVAAGLGVFAVFLREIAAPYAVVCGLLALRERRRGESLVWIVGGVAYLAYYAVHVLNVLEHQMPADLAHEGSWVQLPGLAFVLSTMHVNGWLLPLPPWVTAVAGALALAGLSAPSMAPQVKWSAAAYFMFFWMCGYPFNFYWGWVAAPVWAYAMIHSLEGTRQLWATVSQPFDPAERPPANTSACGAGSSFPQRP